MGGGTSATSSETQTVSLSLPLLPCRLVPTHLRAAAHLSRHSDWATAEALAEEGRLRHPPFRTASPGCIRPELNEGETILSEGERIAALTANMFISLRLSSVLLLQFAVFGCFSMPPARIDSKIPAEALAAHVRFLAGPALKGR